MRIIETERHVYAVDDDDIEICGAFNPVGHQYWQLYVTWKIVNLTGLRTPPHREHFVGNHGQADSRRWIEMIAALYCLAAQQHSTTAETNGHSVTANIQGATP